MRTFDDGEIYFMFFYLLQYVLVTKIKYNRLFFLIYALYN